MRVMSDVTDPVEREHTMTTRQARTGVVDLKALRSLCAHFSRCQTHCPLQLQVGPEYGLAVLKDAPPEALALC